MLLFLLRGFYDFKNLLGTGYWWAGRFSCKCFDPQHRKCLSPHLQPLCQCSPWCTDRVVLGLRLRPSKSLNKFYSLSVDPEKTIANTTSFSRDLSSFFKKGVKNFTDGAFLLLQKIQNTPILLQILAKITKEVMD